MTKSDVIEKLQLKILTGPETLTGEVKGGYTSDLLSDVIANSKEGDFWITLQTHQNIIAVAKLKDLAGIILVNNREPDAETLQKAAAEKIALMSCSDMAFEISGKLFSLLDSSG